MGLGGRGRDLAVAREMTEGHQRRDGGLEKGFVAGAFLAAGDGFGVFRLHRVVVRNGLFGPLRALPAGHRFVEDRGAACWRECSLADGGACPTLANLAEIAADAISVRAEQFGDPASRVARDIEPLDVGQEGILFSSVGSGSRYFSFRLIIHDFLAFSWGIWGLLRPRPNPGPTQAEPRMNLNAPTANSG
jgi:hypothetical protein